jgi:uncharacterized iron-regulated protein
LRHFPALAGLLVLLGAAGALAAPAELHADHPLNGSLWDSRSGRQVAEEAFLAEAATARWVLLGEKHDNAVHHALQARVVGALGRAGRRPAVVWEMAEPEQAEALQEATLETVDSLGAALDWEARGWPAWSEYQPIAEQALTYGLPMRPGKPSTALVRSASRGEPLPAEVAGRLEWSRPYPEGTEAALLEELADSHCGALPEAALEAMLRVQRLWDAWIAGSMLGAEAEGAILIAGSGHVRKDRAVPWHLRGAGGESLTLALVEVVAGREAPADYPAFDPQRFDFVWFTPRVDEKDPCEAFRDKPAK